MNYLELWCQDVLSRRSMVLAKAFTIDGIRDAHLGPRMECARIRTVIEPAPQFEVVVNAGVADAVATRRFVESAILGFLDVALTAGREPIRNVRLTVLDLEVHPIDSTAMAFRLAGRDVAERLLAQLRLGA